MDNTIHIAFCFDQNYSMPCGVSITSICENTPGPICFHALIAGNVTDDAKDKIRKVTGSHGNQVFYYEIDEKRLENLSEFLYFSKSVYYRFMIPELLPKDVTKVLYLDSDVLCVKSLRPIWEIGMDDGVPAAMAYDSGCSNVKFHNRTGIPLTKPYYNNGVILMNLNCWRKEDIAAKCIRSMEENDFVLVDQDAMNVVIGERVKNIPLQFNCQIRFMITPEEEWMLEKEKYFNQIREAISNPALIHYTEPVKPWHKDCQFANEWLKYKAISPWKAEPLSQPFINGSFKIQLDGVTDFNATAVEAIALPLLSFASRLSQKHPRIFVLLRKALWTLAKRKGLVKWQATSFRGDGYPTGR